MSGGFFRGTSADQDTRFSNKQAKLMKSQKFAPELENLVDMTKVKMDVLRPWIAKRVTDLLGFEDDVLINFIYGLLDAKIVNGKEIQISLTGFMEKNTGKFMKELWTHLLSAQKNASGVPQQFLDEKEEETKRKKADADRITNEIQRKKEQEAEESELYEKKMEGGHGSSRNTVTDVKLYMKYRNGRGLSVSPRDRKEISNRNGRSRNNRRSISSNSADSSRSPNRSRSISRSPKTNERSISPERAYRGRKRSITPHRDSNRRSPSPSRGRPSYRRRTSRARSDSRSASPAQFRSFHRRSPYLRRRRSPSLVRRRSPPHKSRSPVRLRSPSRRSRSPIRHRSPPRRSRSPGRRRSLPRRSRSPGRRRSPRASRSPVRRRSRSLGRRRSYSPVHHRSMRRSLTPASPTPRDRSPIPLPGASPIRRRSSPSSRGRRPSPSPLSHRQSPPRRRRSPSPILRHRGDHRCPSTPRHRLASPEAKRPLTYDRRNHRSPSASKSPSTDRSVSASPIPQGSASTSKEKSPTYPTKAVLPLSMGKSSSQKSRKGSESPGKVNMGRSLKEGVSYAPPTALQAQNGPNREVSLRVISSDKSPISSESPGKTDGFPQDELREDQISGRRKSSRDVVDHEMSLVSDEKQKMEDGGQKHGKQANKSKADTRVTVKGGGSDDSGGEDDNKKRKHKGSSDSEGSSEYSEGEEKKDAKRRRKEEKRMRRERRRQRHEEKRRKKEERRAEKHRSSLRAKGEGDYVGSEKKFEDLEGEERKLEIELRNKALESLKAKKGVSN